MIMCFYALTQSNKKELLTLDFENILKYFQATLPKKCRKQRYAKKIITRACNIKLKKLKKYEDEFIEMKGKTCQRLHYKSKNKSDYLFVS